MKPKKPTTDELRTDDKGRAATSAENPTAEANAREEIHEAAETVTGEVPSGRGVVGLSGGSDDVIYNISESAGLIRSIGRMGPSTPRVVPTPKAPDGTDGRDEFDIDLYPHTAGSIKDT